MDRAALSAWIRDHPEIAEQLLRVLARRLINNPHYVDLLAPMRAARVPFSPYPIEPVPATMLIPSSPPSEPAQPQIMSLPQA